MTGNADDLSELAIYRQICIILDITNYTNYS